MIDNFRPKKLRQGRFRRMALEIYYENIYEKDRPKKVQFGFTRMVRGFIASSFFSEDTDAEDPAEMLEEVENLNPEEEKDKLWKIIVVFFSEHFDTDVEKALSDKQGWKTWD